MDRATDGGEDVWVFDAAGGRHLDADNHSVHIGHHNKHVAEAISRLPRHPGPQSEYLEAVTASCAKRMLATLGKQLDCVYFCQTQRDANVFALRLAQRSTRAVGVILSTDCLGPPQERPRLGKSRELRHRLPKWARWLRVPDPVHHPQHGTESVCARFLDDMRRTVGELQDSGFGVAAILLDPLLAYEALPPVSTQVLTDAIGIVRQAGGLYIADESRGGLARTGQHFWAHERCATSPDLMTVGENLANGLPMGVVVAAGHIAASTKLRSPIVRPGWEQLAARTAAEVTLEVLDKEQLRESAARVGAYLRYRLNELKDDQVGAAEVRGEGLYQMIEVVDAHSPSFPGRLPARIVSEMARRRVIVGYVESSRGFIRIRPPMTFALEHVDLLVNALGEALRRASLHEGPLSS